MTSTAMNMTGQTEFLTVDWLLSLFGTDKKIAQQQYRKFVRAGISKKSPWDELDGQTLCN